jgi:hypothetical protein
MTLRELLFTTIDEIGAVITELDRRAPQPCLDRQHRSYRHKTQDRQLAAFLKCARSVSTLNACKVLIEAGHVLEVYTLCRSIDEANEDVSFLLLPLSAEDEPQRGRYLCEFYQEELDVPGKPMESSQSRDRVSRQRIQNALTRTPGPKPMPLEKMRKSADVIHKMFSGFVHGAYVHIMELYDSCRPRLHISGFRGEPKIAECEESFVHNVYRTILATRMLCRSLGYEELDSRLHETQLKLAGETGCNDLQSHQMA